MDDVSHGRAIDFTHSSRTGEAIAAYIRDNWPDRARIHEVHIHKGGEGDPLVVNIPGLPPREFFQPAYFEED